MHEKIEISWHLVCV